MRLLSARRPTFWTLVVAAIGIWGLGAPPAVGDTWVDSHDEPTPVWEVDTTAGAQLLGRERVRVGSESTGQHGAERIAYASPPGTPTWAWRSVPPAAVIDELAIEVDAHTTLPGALLAAEVTLPRTLGADGQPERLRLRSAPARSANGVTTLELKQLALHLQREARVWRLANQNPADKSLADRSRSLDTRGAYVTRIAVGLPGSGRAAQAWVHEVRIKSLVTPLRRTDDAREEVLALTAPNEAPAAVPDPGGTVRPTQVTLRSDGFRIDGELFFPRLWRWRGESFALLSSRGVNTVWLDQAPTKKQLAEAAHQRLRVVCPPPATREAAQTMAPLDRVLAWVLPGALDARGLDAGLVLAEDARALGPDLQRPILAHAAADADAWSRVADGLLLDADAPLTGGAANRFASQARLAPPGTPLLGVLRIDIGPRLTAQLDALLGDGVAVAWLPPADVSAGVDAALVGGAIGVGFTASERLDEADDATAAAAGWLEVVNRRLRLIEPWLTGPHSTHPIALAPPSVLLNRGGVRLAPVASLVAAPDEAASVLLPGVDETARVYRLSPAGLAPWPIQRRAGGVGANRTGGQTPGDLLVCNDPRVVKSLQSYTGKSAPRAAENLAEVAAISLRLTEALEPADRQAALRRLSEARLATSRRDAVAAYDAAHAALAVVATAEARRREIAQRGAMLTSSPLAVLPTTLTDSFRMNQLLAVSPRGPNRLFGGSFEDIDELRRHGWRRPASDAAVNQLPADRAPSGQVEVELLEANAVHGQRVLRLRGESPVAVSRIESPQLELAAADTIEVTGWARVEAAATGVLVVSDSLGGDELALSIGSTGGEWRPFQLLRATAADTTWRLTLSIEGEITADVDGVMVRTVEPLGVASRAAATAGAGRK